jgi:succinyl-CoA synthetase beta subunit
MTKLYDLFLKCDCTQVEINPFVETDSNKGIFCCFCVISFIYIIYLFLLFVYLFVLVYCIDAKLNFDDNAEFRQKEIFAMRDPTEEDPREVEGLFHFFFVRSFLSLFICLCLFVC